MPSTQTEQHFGNQLFKVLNPVVCRFLFTFFYIVFWLGDSPGESPQFVEARWPQSPYAQDKYYGAVSQSNFMEKRVFALGSPLLLSTPHVVATLTSFLIYQARSL